MDDKAIRAAKLTLGAMLEKKRAKTAVERAQGQIAPSKYLPNVPRQVHADGGRATNLAAWHKDAHEAVKNPDGSPKTFYHRTSQDFSTFKADPDGPSGPAMFFGDDPSNLPQMHNRKKLGDSIMPVYLHMHSPLMLDEFNLKEMQDRHAGGSRDFPHLIHPQVAQSLQRKGFDGIVAEDIYGSGKDANEYVVFDPHQIKSAIGNSGAFDPTDPDITKADGGPVDPAARPPVDLGQVREQKQLQGFHQNLMNDINTRMSATQAAYQKAVDAGHFDGYDVGTVLQGKNSPLKITGHFMQRWKPNSVTLNHFDRLGAKPSIIEHEGQQYIPMLRYTSGSDAGEDNQEGTLYLDAVKATGMRKMGGLRAVKARGGAIHLIHGGSDFDEIDPRYSGTGEPGNIRPLGKGLYTFVLDPDDPESAQNAIGWAKRYATKYGRGKKTLHVFKVPKSASTMFNGPRSIEGLGAEPQEKLAAYRAHRDAEPAKDDPAWWDWSRKGNALYEDVKNAADLRLEHLPIGLTEAAINNPKIAQRVGKFDPEADPDEIIKAIRGYADGGSVDDLPPVGWNRNGVPEDDAVASPLRKAEYPYMSMVPARQVHAEPLRQAINKAHAEAKVMDLPIDQIVTDVSAIGRSRVKNPAGGLPFVERINGVHHLRDGNHRVAAAMLRGDKTVRALVADMDEAIKANGRADGGYVPQKTQKAYKLFRRKDGKLLPLFVNADKPVEMGKWLEAEAGPQGKAQGKVKSKLGDLAYRPGWHAGDLPIATHIGGKSKGDLKAPDYRPDDQVWAEVEMADDHDWQSVANSRGKGVKAAITDQVPLKGFYRFKTNPNMTGNWLIGGHMKVNRVLSDDDVKAINDAAGVADLPRLQRADGGIVERSPMFEGMHEDLQNEDGTPMDLWHGTTASEPFEAFDDSKIGSERDHGFYGRGHYLTPVKGNAEAYADPEEMGAGTVMGPLHAALKNPFIWDTSTKGQRRTLRDLNEMGIMTGKTELEPWDNLQRHHIDPFMREMQKRGHDGVLMKTNRGLSEIVVFNPNMIKHRDAEVGDPNDPRIMRNTGGKVDLFSKAAKIVRGLKDNPMQVEDIIKYALGKGAKKAELDYTDLPRGGMARPSQVADHIEGMQPQIAVIKKGQNYRYGSDNSYLSAIRNAEREGNHDLAEELNREWEAFAGIGLSSQPQYAQYQLPSGKNYREHILSLENHEGPTFTANRHWGRTPNPLAHIRMSDRMIGNKKILHVEEMQSDWNTQARKRGISDGSEQRNLNNFIAEMRQKAISNIDPTASPMIRQALAEKYQAMDPHQLAMKLGMSDQLTDYKYRATPEYMGAPAAPYIHPDRDDWAEMAMKHVLMEAAKGGYDGIAFTPDKAQEERWPGHTFKNMYDGKFPSIAKKLIRQHDPEGGSDDDPQIIAGWGAPHVELTDKARDSINQNGFSSFRRGGYVTHVRRAR